MPRLLILPGIAVLLALLAYALLEGDASDPFEAGREGDAPWAPGANEETAAAAAGRQPGAGPGLKGAGHAEGGAAARDGAKGQAQGPTGPYEFLVVDFESEAPLEHVLISGSDAEAEPLGKTDEEGRLVIEDAGVAKLDFRTQLDGYASYRGTAKPGQQTLVVLQVGITIRGRVVLDAGGAPVENAQLVVWDEDLMSEAAITSTVEDGRFVIRSVRPNYPMKLLVLVDGLVPHEQREFFHTDLDDFEIRVGGGGKLVGRVTNADGKPVPNQDLVLLVGGSTPFMQRKTDTRWRKARARLEAMRSAQTITGEDGRYEFLGAPLKRSVRPAADLGQRHIQKAKRSAYFREPGDVIEIDIEVTPSAALRIRVQDEEGRPIGHAGIEVRAGGGYWNLTSADRHPEGGYLLEDVEPRTVVVTAQLPGAPDQTATVKLESGKVGEVVLTFPRGRSLRGVVKDKRGQPIWKARVVWVGSETKERAETRADEKGRFELTRLASSFGTLGISARDLPWTQRAYERKTFRDLAPSGDPLEVTLLDGTRAYGRFEDLPQGAGVTSELARGSEYDVGHHTVKEDRRFERRGPPPRGKGAIFVFRTRGFPPLIVNEPRPFDSEERRDLGPLRFESTNPRQGRVVDGARRAVHGALVRIQAPWSRRTTRTDIEGDFSFPRLPDENVKIEIEADGFPKTSGILNTSSQFRRQVFFIRRAGALIVSVVGPNGVAVRNEVMVGLKAQSWKRGDPRPLQTHTTAQGRRPAYFHVPPGRYQLFAYDRTTKNATATTVRIRPGPQQHEVLKLQPQRKR